MKNIFHVENLLKQQQHQSEIVQNHEKPIDLRLNKLKIAQSSSSQPISLQQQQQPETINNQQSNGIKIDDDDHDHEQVLFALNKLPTTRSRTLFSDWQLACLEWRFTRNKYLTSSDRRKVAQLLHLRQVQVKTWFQVSFLQAKIRLTLTVYMR